MFSSAGNSPMMTVGGGLHRWWASPVVSFTGGELHRWWASPVVGFTGGGLHRWRASLVTSFSVRSAFFVRSGFDCARIFSPSGGASLLSGNWFDHFPVFQIDKCLFDNVL
jgi:hypothetical protein